MLDDRAVSGSFICRRRYLSPLSAVCPMYRAGRATLSIIFMAPSRSRCERSGHNVIYMNKLPVYSYLWLTLLPRAGALQDIGQCQSVHIRVEYTALSWFDHISLFIFPLFIYFISCHTAHSYTHGTYILYKQELQTQNGSSVGPACTHMHTHTHVSS